MTIGPTTAGFPTGTDIANIDPSTVDLTRVQREWERQLDTLLDAWFGITADQRRQIEAQVRLAVHADDIAALAKLSVSTAAAEEALVQAMNDMALRAAEHVVDEARDQGVRIDPVSTDRAMFGPFAAAVALLLAEGLTNAAGREALRLWSPQATGDEVSSAVDEHLAALSTSFLETNLGGALTTAQNAGRRDTLLAGPTAAIYASEQMDKNTCGPCRRINGKWIGNSDDPTIADKIAAIYPNGGYTDCEGGRRCRGTVVSIYRPQQVASALLYLPTNHPGHADQKSHGRKGGKGLAGAKDIASLNAAASAEFKRITGRNTEVDMKGSDLKVAREHLEGVLEAQAKYPGVRIDRVVTYGPGGARPDLRFSREAFAESRYALSEPTIGFNAENAGRPAAYRSDLEAMHRSGYEVFNNPRGVALHEFGHQLEQQTASAAISGKVARASARGAGEKPQQHISSRISTYATTNNAELSAEAFADVMVNGGSASAPSQAIFDALTTRYTAYQ